MLLSSLARAMKILGWKYRGLGNPRAVQSLYFLAKEKKPDIVFLMETRLKACKVESIKRKMRMVGCVVVEPRGMSGGLMLMWKNDREVELLNYSYWHINVWVKGGCRGISGC